MSVYRVDSRLLTTDSWPVTKEVTFQKNIFTTNFTGKVTRLLFVLLLVC